MLNGVGDPNLDGDIDTNGVAWKLFARNGAQVGAERRLAVPMMTGQTLSIDLDVEALPNNVFAIVDFATDTSLIPRMSFGLRDGAPNYHYYDNAGDIDSGVAVNEEGLRIEFTITGPSTYKMRLVPGVGAPSERSGPLHVPGAITMVGVYLTADVSSVTRHAYFNSAELVPEPGAASGEPAAAVVLLLYRRRRRARSSASTSASSAPHPAAPRRLAIPRRLLSAVGIGEVDLAVAVVVVAVVAGGRLEQRRGARAARIGGEVDEPIAVVVDSVVAIRTLRRILERSALEIRREVGVAVAVVVHAVRARGARSDGEIHLARDRPARRHRETRASAPRIDLHHLRAAAARAGAGARVRHVDRAARGDGHRDRLDPGRAGRERRARSVGRIHAEHAGPDAEARTHREDRAVRFEREVVPLIAREARRDVRHRGSVRRHAEDAVAERSEAGDEQRARRLAGQRIADEDAEPRRRQREQRRLRRDAAVDERDPREAAGFEHHGVACRVEDEL